jgi:DNA topoisomerase VI subunit B
MTDISDKESEVNMKNLQVRKWIVAVLVILVCCISTENSFCSSIKNSLVEANEMELRAIRERAKILAVLFYRGAEQRVQRVHFRTSVVYELNDLIEQMNRLNERGLPTRISPLPKPIVIFIVPGIEHYSMGELMLKSGQIIAIIDLLLGEQTELDIDKKGGKK